MLSYIVNTDYIVHLRLKDYHDFHHTVPVTQSKKRWRPSAGGVVVALSNRGNNGFYWSHPRHVWPMGSEIMHI